MVSPEKPTLPVTVTGAVEAGVEHRSVVLRDDAGQTWQVGRAGAEVVGRRVRVRGVPRPDVLTTAQQGTPLAVLELTVLDAPGAAGSP